MRIAVSGGYLEKFTGEHNMVCEELKNIFKWATSAYKACSVLLFYVAHIVCCLCVFCVWSLLLYCVFSSFAIILTRKSKLVVFL